MKNFFKIIGKALGVTVLIAIGLSIVIILVKPKQTEFGACYDTCKSATNFNNEVCLYRCEPGGK